MNQTTIANVSSSQATRAALQQARIAIVSANWHSDVVHQARDAAVRRLTALGAAPARLHQVEVPGAFEIPLMAQKLAASGQFDAVIGCAVIVNGGIYHHEFVSAAVVDGLMRVQLDTGVPVFSVALTPHNFQPTEDLLGFFRSHFVHKGEEAADACAQTLAAHADIDALLTQAVAT
ncbi:6,7-dimethyl-8-ribityllumazine synthase [Comamonas sp. 17RB]|uniref:6,7-dimethyl-8-ribityllumazine synthase n=1 Tax=Comamonas sp. 17RB TaxID=3047025 RepID=UPI0024B83880|nr:6,7-dimethyl-8-ribityllumazine synthase [Comamonas sp. 17RB]MDI9857074.1 6,7-dimethyl-8-ribityllumazine synthase [Comamonas sp. 17RB]